VDGRASWFVPKALGATLFAHADEFPFSFNQVAGTAPAHLKSDTLTQALCRSGSAAHHSHVSTFVDLTA
jgi:hypothetical protein